MQRYHHLKPIGGEEAVIFAELYDADSRDKNYSISTHSNSVLTSDYDSDGSYDVAWKDKYLINDHCIFARFFHYNKEEYVIAISEDYNDNLVDISILSDNSVNVILYNSVTQKEKIKNFVFREFVQTNST